MKKLWKKANRGLLLSAVALTMLIIYVIVDYANFQSEKDTINQAINNYYSDIYEINGDYDGNPQTHKSAIEKLIDTNWTSTSPSMDWCTTKSNMLSYTDYIFEYLKNGGVHEISNVDLKIDSMKISKSGPGYAKVILSFSTTITGNSDSCIITPSNYRFLDEQYYDEYNDKFNNEENTQVDYENKECSLTYTVKDAIIEMHKENDIWKICGIDAYEYDSSVTYAEEEN